MNEDTLTLYYYNDGLSNAERQVIANALAADPVLADRYQSLCQELTGLGETESIVPPTDMVQRWHDGLDRAAGMEAQTASKPAVHSWSFLLGAAVTAALAIGVGIGVLISGDEQANTPVMQEIIASTATSSSNPFIRGLQVHLRESERGLATLADDTGADRTLLIMNIIEQNRLFERAAEQNESGNLARVLRAFELVLVQLAAEDISPAEAEALRAKLMFELNVVLTKLSRDTSDEPQSI
jgi:hypothetical protein